MDKTKRRMPTLEDAQKAFSRIPKNLLLAFAAACVFFLIYHAGYFDDRMVNEDVRHLITHDHQRIAIGRFFCHNLVTDYCNAWTIGCISCLYCALSTVFVVDLLRVRTKLGAILTAVLLVGIPSLCYAFEFLSGAHLTARLYFLTVLAVWITDRWRWGTVLGIVVLAVAIGIRQAAVSSAAILCALALIRDVLFDERIRYKDLLKKALRFLALGIFGVCLYFLLWKIVRDYTGVSMSDYKGLGGLGQFSIKVFLKAVINSYSVFWGFFFKGRFFYLSQLQKIAYAVIFALSGFAFVFASVNNPKRIPGILICLLLLPPCIDCIAIAVPEMDTDVLIIYPIVYCLILCICLAERSMPHNGFGVITSWLLIVAIAITGICYLDITSAFYVKAETYHEHTMAYENRLLMRIEETPGYYPGIPVAIVSDTSNEYRGLPSEAFPHVINDRDLWYSYVGSYTNAMKKTLDLIKSYTGVSLTRATSAQVQQIHASDEFSQMSAFPMEGSTRVINGILCVNCVYREVIIMQADEKTLLLNYCDYASDADGSTYAWYVYKNNTRVAELERGYRDVPEHLVVLNEDGNYYFKCFAQQGNIKRSVKSIQVVVKNGVIIADNRLHHISMEEALSRALPSVQINAAITGDRSVVLTIIDNTLHADQDCLFAWRVYRDGEHIEEYDRVFDREPQYALCLKEDGKYSFELLYRKGNAGEASVMSDEIEISHEINVLRAGKNTVLLTYIGQAITEDNVSYAWYVYNGEVMDGAKGRDYQMTSEHLVTLDEDGIYTFKCFYIVSKEKYSVLSFPVVVANGVIVDDPRLGEISMEEAMRLSEPEIEVKVTLAGERVVELNMIDNTHKAGLDYTYAWYVYRNGERLKEYDRGYSFDPKYDLILVEDGEYQFKLFYRMGNTTCSVKSESIHIGEEQNAENAA